MIYTSYFYQVRNLPTNIIPISISTSTPEWFKGLSYNKLSPGYDILNKYKTTNDFIHYEERFRKEILGKLDLNIVLEDLSKMINVSVEELISTNRYNICLMCYENLTKPCHRHIVKDWFIENNIQCSEYNN